MAYYLAVETEKQIYEALKIKKSKFFNQNQLEGTYECTLEEIENYTTQFSNFSELSHNLTSYGILRYRDVNKPFAIFYVNGIEVRKIEGNILYKESKQLIENPQSVVDYIENKFKENDMSFFRKLQPTLPDTSIINYMIAILATSMETNYLNQLQQRKQTTIDQKLVSTVAQSLIHDCYIDGIGELIIKNTINKEQLHKMVSFITDYENNLKLTQTNYVRKREKPQ